MPIPKNVLSYKFLDWSLVAIYIGTSYLRLIHIDEVQLKYFIAVSMPLLLVVELHNINMPIACLFMIYLVIYNGSFTINYILHARYFQIVYLSLQIFALLLFTLIIFNSMPLELLDPFFNMKKSTAETLGKVIASELSKVKPLKIPDSYLPAVIDTGKEEGFY